jgi:hypothetical protein
MTRWLFTLLTAAAGFAAAQAGGPPPVYVVVDKVTLEPSADAPDRIKIHGTFVRLADVHKYEYGKPVEGYVYLDLGENAAKARAEWEAWKKAAGTGKVVAVGSCGEAGTFLSAPIHKPTDRAAKPDAAYKAGLLYADTDRWWEREPAVRDLLAHVKARKLASAAADKPRP